MSSSLRFGIDQLLAAGPARLPGRLGLVTNDAAATAAGPGAPHPLTPSRLALVHAGFQLVRLFSPEHGLAASAADGAHVGDERDPLTGLPVISLYGARFRPEPEHLADLDALLFDIPDVGARFYTYIWTLSHVLEACAASGLPLIVLDRPNPLGGDLHSAEGPLLDEAAVSTFVGRWNMPIRHSLSAGELAHLWRAERGLDLPLEVFPVEGWTRAHQWIDTSLPFVPPSPSLPGPETALLYPGTCLIEGTKLSEGRGTAAPFRQVGAPWLDHFALADAFNALALPGVAARPVHFTPSASKWAGEPCRGVMLHVTDRHALRPVAAGLHLLALIIRHHPADFAWLPYPTAANAPGYGHFDRLIGRLDIRTVLADATPEQIAAWTAAPNWAERAAPHLLYR